MAERNIFWASRLQMERQQLSTKHKLNRCTRPLLPVLISIILFCQRGKRIKVYLDFLDVDILGSLYILLNTLNTWKQSSLPINPFTKTVLITCIISQTVNFNCKSTKTVFYMYNVHISSLIVYFTCMSSLKGLFTCLTSQTLYLQV